MLLTTVLKYLIHNLILLSKVWSENIKIAIIVVLTIFINKQKKKKSACIFAKKQNKLKIF